MSSYAMPKNRKQTSQTADEACRPALSVHYRVPTEVWEIIFSILCSILHRYSFRVDHDFRDGSLELELPALELSQVCSRWRGIAKSIPRLWSSICIDFINLPFDIVSPLELHLSNSKDHPLDICIVRDTYPIPPLCERGSAAWRILSQHIQRCRNLYFRAVDLNFPEIRDLSFPVLESLREETVRYDDGGEEDSWLWQAIRRAPRLTSVSLWDFHRALPLSQLTVLELCCAARGEIEQFFDVLPACERLAHLCLQGLDDSGMETVPFRRVEAPSSFRKLSISDQYCSAIVANDPLLSALLRALSMPTLVCFELRCEDWPPWLLAMAERSPLLEDVRLMLHSPTDSDVPSHPLIKFLQPLHNLTRFELSIGSVGRSGYGNEVLAAVLSLFEKEPDRDTFLPKLRYLDLQLSDLTLDSTVVERALATLANRRFTSRNLKEFRLYRNSISGDDEERE
ncbi:hypothetical protein V5O48_018298, partial [Marasmius crinis-equi]